jgi:hypothetical protein
LQARGAYKEVPRASRRLALATPKSPWACTRIRAKITLIIGYINYIIKVKFLPCFKAAFNALITKSNILGSFQGISLVPFNLEAVLLKLKIQLRTPTPPTIEDTL